MWGPPLPKMQTRSIQSLIVHQGHCSVFDWHPTIIKNITTSGNYSGHFSLKTQCTARCSRACDSVKGEHLIYNRTPANSRFSEKNKNRKKPLCLMQNGSDEPLMLWPSENPPSKLGIFQPATTSPYRVLHKAQGDKQKKLVTVTIVECSAGRMDNSILFAAVRLVQSWKG